MYHNTRGAVSVLLASALALILAALLPVTVREATPLGYTAPVELVSPYVAEIATVAAESDCGFCEVCGQADKRETHHSDYAQTNGNIKKGSHYCETPAISGTCGHASCGSAMAPVAETLDQALYAALDGDFAPARAAAVAYPELVRFNTALGTVDMNHPCVEGALYGRVSLPEAAVL